ncbi:unnamed protein product [Linum tenue]|uniref:Alpha-glucosidase n=1 Tax=Linum tenue TaxID=586396 RepID=A0AAV0NNK9_9ROSI|nr:unnamed protein product [Linum tenue]
MASLLLLLLVSFLFLQFATFSSSSSSSSSTEIVPPIVGEGYRLISIQETPDGGLIGQLQVKQANNFYGPDIPLLQLFIKPETEHRLRVHITDAENPRWEVPYDLLPRERVPPPSSANNVEQYGVVVDDNYTTTYGELVFSYTPDPFGFLVTRKSNGDTLFDTRPDREPDRPPFGPMVFKDQYLEISTKLPAEASLYGLGDHVQPGGGFRLTPSRDRPYTQYTSDLPADTLNTALYGSHPVYMDLRNSNGSEPRAHGVLLLNSNGMDVFYEGDSLTYKVIGGVFDLYFFAGPTPLDVVEQYTSLAGFHQSKWGYENISVVEQVIENYMKADIPLDVIWNDDDHMDYHKDFTVSPENYPLDKLKSFLEKIHSLGMKYVVLTNPGISVNSTYEVYQRGMADDVFIKFDEQPYLGKLWVGPVHYPDFLNPKTVSWWEDEIRRFHDMVPIDGLWLDMNEPSNFCPGLCNFPLGDCHSWECCLVCRKINETKKWEDPPYKINVMGSKEYIGLHTIAASAFHYNGVLEYDAHSLYALSHAIATHKALSSIKGKRPFILSRSTYVGIGHYAAHWTGDNTGDWDNLKYSIPAMLNFGIFGVPMVGSDICGHYPAWSSSMEELCNRWIEVGAFYPFSRNHANLWSPRQELYLWESVAESARNALKMRYRLLPFLYTLNYEAHTTGTPIARPLFFSFPGYAESYGISTQFLLGSSLMISPVLEQGDTQVKALFPPGSWYNVFDMSECVESKGEYYTLDAPLNVINVHLYQNAILPMQQGGMITKDARTTPFSIVVSFPFGSFVDGGEARGRIFIDNDELVEMKLGNGESTLVELRATVIHGNVTLWSEVEDGEFVLSKGLIVEKVSVLGLGGSGAPRDVRVNWNPISADSKIQVRSSEQRRIGRDDRGSMSMMVEISGLEIPLGNNFIITLNMPES